MKERRTPPMLPHKALKKEANAKAKAAVIAVADQVFDRFVAGQSFQQIADELQLGIPGWKLRKIVVDTPDLAELFADMNSIRAHNLVDAAVDFARQAAAIGDAAGLRVAIDTNLKVAAKLAAAEYGDKQKVELTGKDGSALHVKADLTLTAEQAYERLIKGE